MENYEVLQVEGGKPVKAWVKGVELEDEARKQLLNVSKMPFVFKHIGVMPDVHHGIGATIGSVIATRGAIIPAAVGVDIGCGMMAVKTSLLRQELPDDLKPLRSIIENAVPHGRTNNGGPGDRGAWHDVPPGVQMTWDCELAKTFAEIIAKHPKAEGKNTFRHLATLGTGNHFVELCTDELGYVWVMLHSGSRGVGNRFGQYFIELAKEDMKTWHINLPDEDLAYLPEGTEHFKDYVQAVSWAQHYAMLNRRLMMKHILDALVAFLAQHDRHPLTFGITDTAVNCHHNYVARENHFGQNVLVTRKGAVSAKLGELGIIPGSMGAKSYIVRGKGNPESFTSCSHGAGRRMSRTKAKQQISLAQHEEDTKGVECRKDADVIDESPRAYKDIDAVMEAQHDLVEIVHTLKQFLCVKG